jgi:hypothetical protein
LYEGKSFFWLDAQLYASPRMIAATNANAIPSQVHHLTDAKTKARTRTTAKQMTTMTVAGTQPRVGADAKLTP